MAETAQKKADQSTVAKSKARKKTSAGPKAVAKKASPKTSTSESSKSAAVTDIFSHSPISMIGGEAAMPEAFRDITEKSLGQTREAYETAKDAVDDATDALETSLDLAGRGAQTFNMKMIEMAQDNMNSGFKFMKDLASIRDISEAFEVQSTYMRNQIETVSTQAKELQELSTTMVQQSSEPIKEQLTRSVTRLSASN